jgi:hypothetical protein
MYPRFNVPPSLYGWLIPNADLAVVDALATEGTFPSLDGLLPAVSCAIVLGVLRSILQRHLFRVIFWTLFVFVIEECKRLICFLYLAVLHMVYGLDT